MSKSFNHAVINLQDIEVKRANISHEEIIADFRVAVSQLYDLEVIGAGVTSSLSDIIATPGDGGGGGGGGGRGNACLGRVDALLESPVAFYLVTGVQQNSSGLVTRPEYDISERLAVSRPQFSVYDVLTFTPALLTSSHTKLLFLVYQVFRTIRTCHQTGLSVGSLRSRDVYVVGGATSCLDYLTPLWTRITPLTFNLDDDHHDDELGRAAGCYSDAHTTTPAVYAKSLNEATCQWSVGDLSNFDYLMTLNDMALRRTDSADHHAILPWVNDFAGHRRDLTKSKYRLNKGDSQLDMTYGVTDCDPAGSAVNNQVKHHVTDFLSDITYYIYKARCTSQHTLCNHVRNKWVPEEYPSSMQRIYKWTPDECIPEFFTCPDLFKSIHDDLPDLQVNNGNKSPHYIYEKFYSLPEHLFHSITSAASRGALEPWCFPGEDVRAFLDWHMSEMESDYVSMNLHHWIDLTFGYKLTGEEAVQSMNVCLQLVDQHEDLRNHGIVQLFTEPHPLKRMKRDLQNTQCPTTPVGSNPLTSTDKRASSSQGIEVTPRTIELDVDYDPSEALRHVENMYDFLTTTTGCPPLIKSQKIQQVDKFLILQSHDLQEFACFIFDLYYPTEVKAMTSATSNLSFRFSRCVHLYTENPSRIPRCLMRYVHCLLDASHNSHHTQRVQHKPALFLYPSLYTSDNLRSVDTQLAAVGTACLSRASFPGSFPTCYQLLHAFETIDATLLRNTRLRQDEVDTLLRSKVTLICEALPDLCMVDNIDLLHPYVSSLFSDVRTCVKACYELFEPLSKLLTSDLIKKYVLPALLLAYRDEHVSRDSMKLYDRRWVALLMSGIGMSTFLQRFSSIFIEAATGYKDVDAENKGDSSTTEPAPPLSHSTPVTKRCSDSDREDDDDYDEDEDEELCSMRSMVRSETEEFASLLLDEAPSNLRINVSDVAMETIKWLLHKIGPVLSTKHFARNLLRMLTLCYFNDSNNQLMQGGTHKCTDHVLDCLAAVAVLYGEQIIIIHYFQHVKDQIAGCQTKLSLRSESAILASVLLFVHMIPFLSDKTILEILQESVINEILLPLIRMVSSPYYAFPRGTSSRKATLYGLIDAMYLLSVRLGFEQTRHKLTFVFQKFFAAFSRVHGDGSRKESLEIMQKNSEREKESQSLNADDKTESPNNDVLDDSIYFEIKKNSITDEYHIGTPVAARTMLDQSEPSAVDAKTGGGGDPPSFIQLRSEEDNLINRELIDTFTPSMAHAAYIPLCKIAGSIYMEQYLINDEEIRDLCFQYDNSISTASSMNHSSEMEHPTRSFTSGQIDYDLVKSDAMKHHDQRHLVGNWLAYWEHEVGRSSNIFDFKQIRLLTFTGHSGPVRRIQSLNNENSFLTASKDKTVKLWSLRNYGEGCEKVGASFTYKQHKKGVSCVEYLKSWRYVASCDGTVHIWDPFIGETIQSYDSSRNNAITTMHAMIDGQIIVSTADTLLRFIDIRAKAFTHSYKCSTTLAGIIRCITSNHESKVIAVGYSSGLITTMHLHTGIILCSWRGHDTEILELKLFADHQLMSSSLDQSICVWNADSGALISSTKGLSEPVHCIVNYHSSLVLGSTSNKISVFKDLNAKTCTNTTRLRSDTFKGMLTTLCILQENSLLLIGSDNGNVQLMA